MKLCYNQLFYQYGKNLIIAVYSSKLNYDTLELMGMLE